MKSKKLIKTLGGLGAALILGTSTQAIADNTTKCGINASLAQKSEYRVDSGFTLVDGPITEGSIKLNCGNFDVFAWSAYNNNTNKINEVDVGFGYSFVKGNIDGRIGLVRSNYSERGGKNDVLTGNVNYHGLPVDLGARVAKILDDKGTQVIGSISKTFKLGNVAGIPLTLTPSVKIAYLDNFFGITGHSNDVYGLSLNGEKKTTKFGVFMDRHNGRKGFGNSTQVGITLGHSF